MKQSRMVSAVLITVPLVFLAACSALAEREPGGEEAALTTAEKSTPADAVESGEEAALTTAEKSTPADAVESGEVAEATGLDIVMDGSSLEAFEKSLERVKETGSEEDYNGLKSALDYLLLYDLGSQRNRTKLAARLDGTTGYEIVERVKWRRKK